MLTRRLLRVLTGYAATVALVLSAIMLVPTLMEGLNDPHEEGEDFLHRVFAPLPALWLTLLPTALMISVLIGFSRLSLRGEIRQWRAAGASVWPFALPTSLIAVLIAGLMAGPLWTWTQPEGVIPIAMEKTTPRFIDEHGNLWVLPISATAATMAEPSAGAVIVLYSLPPARGALAGQVGAVEADGTILLREVQVTDGLALGIEPTLTLRVWLSPPTGAAEPPDTDEVTGSSSTFFGLSYRLSYPVLVVGLALLILPLALSIDGNRWTLLKIAAGCLLALNILFVLLMTDALVGAGLWDENWFFPLRGALALGLGLLALILFEERAA